MKKIAVDAMGGDNAPQALVEGVNQAIRDFDDIEIVLYAKDVKAGEVDAMLSAGNTGALLAAGFFIVGRIKGVERPGLMSTLPTVDGRGYDMLDLGANAENTPEHLQQ